MATRGLTSTQINALVGSHHPTAGFEYPVNGLQPYYQWLVSSLHLLGEASAGALKVNPDDTTDTTVRIESGRATIDGTVLDWLGGTIDLASFNNETVYVWLHDAGGGLAAIGHDCAANGWPTTVHLKLAQVVLTAGQVDAIIDRRFETVLRHGVDPQVAASFVSYHLTIATQGSTGSPSTVTVQLQDLHHNSISETDYLRVRVCDEAGYTPATNATIAPTASSTTVQTLTTDKDLILRSDTAGLFTIDVTNATAETVTLRIGAATLSSRRGDHGNTLNVTHA